MIEKDLNKLREVFKQDIIVSVVVTKKEQKIIRAETLKKHEEECDEGDYDEGIGGKGMKKPSIKEPLTYFG